jgi:glycosyltransferase involved in cell wall biosynthesis
MKILYDGQIFAWQGAGGVNRYFKCVIEHLPPAYYPTLTQYGDVMLGLPSHPGLRVVRAPSFRPQAVSLRLAAHRFRRVTRAVQPDVAHPTYYSLMTGTKVGDYNCPSVITVHDMIHELFPAEMDGDGRTAKLKRDAVMAASAIVCVSENTKHDLLEMCALPEDRVSVIPNASDIDASIADGPEPVPASRYFLYVGTRAHAYKNFWRLVEAFHVVRRRGHDVRLAVVGAPLTKAERRRLADAGVAAWVDQYPFIRDPHLAKLYRRSAALVYPSLYEGFGIPPLEAMKCGTAVIASNASSIPEVVGDAGLLVDPTSTEELASAMTHVLEDQQGREALIERGHRQAARFSWTATAAAMAALYERLGR